MDAKHTPGPWTVDGPPSNQIVWSDSENRVCFLAHSNGKDEDRDIANGHLIAAAPDMLAALVAIEEWWLTEAMQRNTGAPYAIFAARAAIAKATGQAI